MRRLLGTSLIFAVAGVVTACGEEPMPPPPPPPTQLAIKVIDAATGDPVSGAEVLLEQIGEPKITDAMGSILLDPIEAGRYSYRAQAAGYVLFPRPRRDPPAVQVVKEQTTSIVIALEPRPMAAPGATLEGKVTKAGTPVQGVLVVATSLRAFAAYTDKNGRYAILGIEPNLYAVTAYQQGHTATNVNNVEIAAGETKSVDLSLTESAGATVGGDMIGGTGTSSVVIAHKETHYAVPGLSTAAQFGGTWSISGVPPGDFEVVSALEVDGISYDAQWLLSLRKQDDADDVPYISVTDTSSLTLDLRFAPAITGVMPTDTSTVVPPPSFTWSEVQGTNRYLVEVRNVLGGVIYGGFDNLENPVNPIQAPATMLRYDGAPLTRGALYTWRLFALKSVTTGSLFEIISVSEQLGGEFRVAR